MEGATAMAPCPFPSIMIVCDMMWWSQILGVSTLLPLWFQIQTLLLPGWTKLEEEGDGGTTVMALHPFLLIMITFDMLLGVCVSSLPW